MRITVLLRLCCYVCFIASVLCLSGWSQVLAKESVKPTQSALAVAVDQAIDNALKEKRLVGGVVLVALDGKVIYERAAGYADREAKIPVQLDTQFRLASVSKMFTSLAAAVLVENKVISLDDPVTKWLPDFHPLGPDGKRAVITVRQLLTHTAGLDYGFFENAKGPYRRAGVSDGLDDASVTLEENIRRIGSVPLLYKPGTSWRYSLSTDVLGALIAKAGGGTLPEVMDSLVLEPLQLLDTGFVATDKKRLAVAYRNARPEPVKMREPERFDLPKFRAVFSPARAFDPKAFPSGGAGMVSTAPDVLQVLEVIREQGSPLLSSTLMAVMNSNQVGTLPVEPGWGFGLGWGILLNPKKYGTPMSVGTLSWSGVYGAKWFVDPAKGLSVVILTNTAFEGMSGKLVKDVCNAIYANLSSK